MSLVRTVNLKAALGGVTILPAVDLEIKRGSFVGVIGPNGSGKSTLLKCLYRVLRPVGGAVFLDGKNIDEYSMKESARRMAVLAQHNEQDFEFCVMDFVLMGRSPHKRWLERDSAADLDIARGALEKVGMTDFAERMVSSLSGGEQQRVLLARSLAQGTRCLILDEPTNHLDIRHQFHIFDIVKSLDLTVVAALHDLNMAARYCSDIVVLDRGRIVASGPAERVITSTMIRNIYGVESEILREGGRIKGILFHARGRMQGGIS